MLTHREDNMETDTATEYQLAKSYNLGYEHGMKDMKSRALVGLWKEYLKFKDLDPDLAKLIRQTIETTEKLQ
jgi:hypothetical protein